MKLDIGDNLSLTLILIAVCITFAILMGGCASAQEKATSKDWSIVCQSAPYGAGQSISASEQRAMTRLDLWKVSVEEMNEECHKRQ